MNIEPTEYLPPPIKCAVCKNKIAVVLHQGEDLKVRPVPLCCECIPAMTKRLRKFLQKFGAISPCH